MDWLHILVALVGQNPVLTFVIVSVFVLKRLPWLIAAFRIATANHDAKAKRASKALEAIEPALGLDLAEARLMSRVEAHAEAE